MVAPPPGLKGDDGRLQLLRPGLQGARAGYSRRLPGLSAEHGRLSRAVGVRAPGRRLQAARHAEARGWPGLAKLTRVRESEKKPGRRRVSILVGNGGLYLPQELRRGADGAMTGFAWPEMLVQVCDFRRRQDGGGARTCSTSTCRWCATSSNSASGWRCARKCCSAAAPSRARKQRAPGSSLTATDRAELDNLIARLERRLAAAGRGAKAAAARVREHG